jgi:hypothetical protein
VDYSAAAALKEFLDNSVRALQWNDEPGEGGAVIRIHFDITNDKLWIMDNGHGFKYENLSVWMKQGLHSTSDRDGLSGGRHLCFELGKYGVGAKASMFALGGTVTLYTSAKGETCVGCTKISQEELKRTRKWEFTRWEAEQPNGLNKMQKDLINGFGRRTKPLRDLKNESFTIFEIDGLTNKVKDLFIGKPPLQCLNDIKNGLCASYLHFMDPTINKDPRSNKPNPPIVIVVDCTHPQLDSLQSVQSPTTSDTSDLWSMINGKNSEQLGNIPSFIADYGIYNPNSISNFRGQYTVQYQINPHNPQKTTQLGRKPILCTVVVTYIPKREGDSDFVKPKHVATYWKGRLLIDCKNVVVAFTTYNANNNSSSSSSSSSSSNNTKQPIAAYMYDRLIVRMYLNGEFTPTTSKGRLNDDELARVVRGEIRVGAQSNSEKMKKATVPCPIDELAVLESRTQGIIVREIGYKCKVFHTTEDAPHKVYKDLTLPTAKGSSPSTFKQFLSDMSKYDQDLKMNGIGTLFLVINDHAKTIEPESELGKDFDQEYYLTAESFSFHGKEIAKNTNIKVANVGSIGFTGNMLLKMICNRCDFMGIPSAVMLLGHELIPDESVNDLRPSGPLICVPMKEEHSLQSYTVDLLTDEEKKGIFELG